MSNPQLDLLASRILEKAARQGDGRRLLIGIAGIPGSGKSSAAYPLVDRMNELAQQEVALCIGGDGWHYSQAQLRVMENSSHLFARRGAHFTFDAEAFAAFVASLREDKQTGDISYPTFEHARRDPVEGDGRVEHRHRIVVIEGLYCFLNLHPWSIVGRMLDERIWVDVPRSVARERLIQRHLSEGVEATREASLRRVEQSDLLNADFLIANVMPPTCVLSGDKLTEEDSLAFPVESSEALFDLNPRSVVVAWR